MKFSFRLVFFSNIITHLCFRAFRLPYSHCVYFLLFSFRLEWLLRYFDRITFMNRRYREYSPLQCFDWRDSWWNYHNLSILFFIFMDLIGVRWLFVDHSCSWIKVGPSSVVVVIVVIFCTFLYWHCQSMIIALLLNTLCLLSSMFCNLILIMSIEKKK